MRPVILGSGVALPEKSYEQQEVFDRLIGPVLGGTDRQASIFRHSGVAGRPSALPSLEFHHDRRTTAERNAIWIAEGEPLIVRAARACLEDAGLAPSDIDEVITVSCTGVDTPGPDLWLAERLGLRPDARRAHIGGMGCYAGIPALYRAVSAVEARPWLRVLVASIELCTLHFQHERTMENIVVSSLFSDGAAAVLVGPPGPGRSGPAFERFRTWTETGLIGHMGFHLTDHGFRMRLSPEVPSAVEALLPPALARLLERTGLTISRIDPWLVHPGGVRILDAVERSLGLEGGRLALSRSLLARHGNLSSATSLFLLHEARRAGLFGRGEAGILVSFGPGLTVESALLLPVTR